MTDLKEVTFLIAIKIDSQDRVVNLNTTIQYLQKNFNTNIILCEQDKDAKLQGKHNCNYVFYKTEDFFNRQRGVNIAARLAKTPIIAHYDADVLIEPSQLVKAAKIILEKRADIIYPYDGRFYDVPKKFHQLIQESNSVEGINLEHCQLFNSHSVGGVVFFNTQVFWEGGAANENFKGLGYEDNEIYTRFFRLDYRLGRVKGPLLHLTHERKETSFNYNPYTQNNIQEYNRIANLSKQSLIEEVKNWKWCQGT